MASILSREKTFFFLFLFHFLALFLPQWSILSKSIQEFQLRFPFKTGLRLLKILVCDRLKIKQIYLKTEDFWNTTISEIISTSYGFLFLDRILLYLSQCTVLWLLTSFVVSSHYPRKKWWCGAGFDCQSVFCFFFLSHGGPK